MLFPSYLLTLFQNKSSCRTWFALKLMRRRKTFSCEWFCTKTHINTKTKGAVKQPSIPMEGQWKFQEGGTQSWKQEILNENIKYNWNSPLLWLGHRYFFLQNTFNATGKWSSESKLSILKKLIYSCLYLPGLLNWAHLTEIRGKRTNEVMSSIWIPIKTCNLKENIFIDWVLFSYSCK